MDSDERIIAAVCHGLRVAGDAALGFGVLGLAEAAGDFLLDLAYAKVPLGAIVRERHVLVGGEEQDRDIVCFESLPEVECIGLGDAAALAGLADRQGRWPTSVSTH